MIISVNWLKQFTEITMPIDELATLIGSRLVEVEAVIDVGARYAGVIIADVVKVSPHPNADKLKVVHIDDGDNNQTVKRLPNNLVELVCGAPNVQEGMKVVWIPPGATLSATHGDPKPVVLEARELRGVVSNGMLASAKELGIGDDHAGIVAVDKDVPAGTSFAAAYELDDYLLDIENKSLTHRPDCFGLIGFAREVAAIQGNQFTTPAWLMATEPILEPLAEGFKPLTITAHVTEPEISKRYQLLAFDNVDASKSSPFAIQTWLARVGIRPISAVVDITNYLMYVTGQPLHAFDLDAVLAEHPDQKADIVVREAIEGETLALLDGRTITLAGDDIVICAGQKPIALAGAMGGANTEITTKTKRVLLESATFDLYRLRATQMRHGIFSEAITRFTKGQSAVQTAPVLASAARMVQAVTGARRISDIIDEFPGRETVEPITITTAQINHVLGTQLSHETIDATLQHVEMAVEVKGEQLHITPPYWRADIHLSEDIIEEIGRITGFDAITPRLPLRAAKAVTPSVGDQAKDLLRQHLVQAGANEVLSYSFVPEKLLQKANQHASEAFKITNALSPELQYYRLSLTPSLLDKVHMNIKAGFESFALFELNKVHQKQALQAGLPEELTHLALVTSAAKPAKNSGAAYFQAKRLLTHMAEKTGLQLSYKPLSAGLPHPLTAPFMAKRSAEVCLPSGEAVGVIGEYKPEVAKHFKLPVYTAGFELNVDALADHIHAATLYQPLGRYPGTSRDITFKINADTPFAALEKTIQTVLAVSPLETHLEPISIYKSEKDASEYLSITLRLYLKNHEQTITAEQANQLVEQVVAAAASQLNAQVV